MQPLVTIITPSLNQRQFIEETIRSVLAQEYAPIEYLLYDGGSTDGTAEVIARYRDRLQAVIQPDRGQSDALNQGLRAARGEIVAWLNSDDLYLPGAISAAVRYLIAHPEHAMVYGEARYIDTAGTTIGRYPTKSIARLQDGCYLCQPATFMRTQAVRTVGCLDASLHYCMDYDLWLRLAHCFSVGHIEQELACSRLHAGAKTIAQQLAFHREVVHMTHRRLGATPLPWLYGYASQLVRDRWPTVTPLGRGLASMFVTLALAWRYHRRVSRRDVAMMFRRLHADE